MKKQNIAVIGAGYWGPNLLRNFYQIPECEVSLCCDRDETRLERIQNLYRHVKTTTDLNDVINNPDIDAVAIATPVHTHAPIGLKCLNAGKHVMIEKPMALSSEESSALIQAAERNDKTLMVGHTFEYVAAVRKTKEIIDSGELGDIQYISSQRVNLGLFQKDINVIWDLAPHDISIILYLLGENPATVNAQGRAHYRPHIEDVATMTMNFSCGAIAFLHVSWLDPAKIRKFTIVGSKKMLVYDDLGGNEKIKIYDKGVDAPAYSDTYAEFQFSYRYGDIYIPHFTESEPLRLECGHFLESIQNGTRPQTDGYNGLQVVSILEAANESLVKGGAQQVIESPEQLLRRTQIRMAI